MAEKQEVKVTPGCGCGPIIGFFLLFGLAAAAVEDIGKHPGTWIPILIIVALIAAGGFYLWQQQQSEAQAQAAAAEAARAAEVEAERTAAIEAASAIAGDAKIVLDSTALPTGEKICPDCAERVKVEARLCRYCGHKFS